MKNILILLICFTLLCCKKDKNVNASKPEKTYIISVEENKIIKEIDSINNLKKNEKIALPQKGFYGENNLIIDENNVVYYYQRRSVPNVVYYYQRRSVPVLCSYGIKNDNLPEFLNLQPKDLIKIPKDYIAQIIYENVMTKEKRKQILIIASQNDTIKDIKLLRFLHHMKVPTYIIRRTTQEEDTVLVYKKTNKCYYSDEIKWDKKRIKV